jgi:oxaloacetate decarboxylase beta subunit
MSASSFLQWETIQIMLLGLVAFVLDTFAGLLFGKFLAFASRGTINPLIGAAGISAFPMAGRLAAKVAQDEDFDNYILMHAMGANTAGQLASVIAGVLLALLRYSLNEKLPHSSCLSLRDFHQSLGVVMNFERLFMC